MRTAQAYMAHLQQHLVITGGGVLRGVKSRLPYLFNHQRIGEQFFQDPCARIIAHQAQIATADRARGKGCGRNYPIQIAHFLS